MISFDTAYYIRFAGNSLYYYIADGRMNGEEKERTKREGERMGLREWEKSFSYIIPFIQYQRALAFATRGCYFTLRYFHFFVRVAPHSVLSAMASGSK